MPAKRSSDWQRVARRDPTGRAFTGRMVSPEGCIFLLGIIPLFIVWFGIGELPKVLIVVLGALFPMYVNTFAGIRSVAPKLRELGQVLSLTRRELITQIVLPGAHDLRDQLAPGEAKDLPEL